MTKTAIHFKTIAVDFDDTLCYSKWSDCGQPNHVLIAYLLQWKHEGNKLILWVCRAGDVFSKAVEQCKEHNLEFDTTTDNIRSYNIWSKKMNLASGCRSKDIYFFY